ncbi:MAG: hypothetical protein QOD92_3158 [Acidimicrobiaceae bacterium]
MLVAFRSAAVIVLLTGCAAAMLSARDAQAHPTGANTPEATRVTSFDSATVVQGELNQSASAGIAGIRAVPTGSYCAEAVAGYRDKGSYRAPTGFLTTLSPGDPHRCNTVALEFTFVAPVQSVAVSFWGANSPYLLTAFDAEGRIVASASQNACPYDYEDDFRVAVVAPAPVITRVTFGYEAALTMVRSISLGRQWSAVDV